MDLLLFAIFANLFLKTLGISRKKYAITTPIDQLATQYLGLNVSYTRLSPDGSLCGLTAYTDTGYQIREMGVVRNIPLKRNQVLLDSSFIMSGRAEISSSRRRFTLAHECAHQILFQLETDVQKTACIKQYSERTAYSLRDLKTREDWNEWQANVLGSAILMPQREVDRFMRNRIGGRKLKNYGGIFSNSDKVTLLMLCHTFDVSKSSAVIRLKSLGYVEDHPRSEYDDPLEVLAWTGPFI